MPSQYDPQLAILLAGLCEQTYIQYGNGPPPANNGKITVPQGYTQVASFIAPDISGIELSLQSSRVHPLSNVDWARYARVRSFGRAFRIPRRLFRFRADLGEQQHHRAARNTHPFDPGASTPRCRRFPCRSSGITTTNSSWRVFTWAFFVLFALLADQILEATKGFNSSLPCLVTGHSLGAALAVPGIADCRSAHRQ